MSREKKSPASQQGHTHRKDSHLSPNDFRVLQFLSQGRYNVVEIAKALNIPDPRSNIRYLRKAGYPISDFWDRTEYSRCKIYFIKEIGGSNG